MHTPLALLIFCRVCKPNRGKSNCPAPTATQATKRIKLVFPQPRSRQQATCNLGASKGSRRNRGRGEWQLEKLKTETKNWKSENRKLWPRPCARLSGQLQIYNTIFHVAATNLCGPPLHTLPPPAPSLPCPLGSCWAATSFATCLRFLGRCAASFPFIVCPFFLRGAGAGALSLTVRGRALSGGRGDNIMWHRALRIEVAMSQCRERANPKTKT